MAWKGLLNSHRWKTKMMATMVIMLEVMRMGMIQLSRVSGMFMT